MAARETSKLIPRVRKGQRAMRASDYNALVDFANREITGTRPPEQRFGRASAQQVRIFPAQIMALADDTVQVREVRNGAMVGPPATVAKPYELRRTAFDGGTIQTIAGEVTLAYSSAMERTATLDGEDEEQAVTPIYYIAEGEQVPDQIVVLSGISTGLVSSGGAPITLLDMNVGARVWARKQPEEP